MLLLYLQTDTSKQNWQDQEIQNLKNKTEKCGLIIQEQHKGAVSVHLLYISMYTAVNRKGKPPTYNRKWTS